MGCDNAVNELVDGYVAISIHAPIVGCDIVEDEPLTVRLISIHAPIVGCDTKKLKTTNRNTKFQSTHPSWGATTTQSKN